MRRFSKSTLGTIMDMMGLPMNPEWAACITARLKSITTGGPNQQFVENDQMGEIRPAPQQLASLIIQSYNKKCN